MITIKTFVFNAFQENTYVIYDDSNECVVIDPGCSNDEERNELDKYINTLTLKPVAMVNTHCHVDHVLGCRYVKDKYKVPFYVNEADKFLLDTIEEHAGFFGLSLDRPPKPDYFLTDGQQFSFGNSTLDVPGHSAGSIALYAGSDGFVITGDALFKGSIGRTDLPGGDFQTLITSIRKKLLVLPEAVMVFPGHGPYTTVGDEKDSNPFLIN